MVAISRVHHLILSEILLACTNRLILWAYVVLIVSPGFLFSLMASARPARRRQALGQRSPSPAPTQRNDSDTTPTFKVVIPAHHFAECTYDHDAGHGRREYTRGLCTALRADKYRMFSLAWHAHGTYTSFLRFSRAIEASSGAAQPTDSTSAPVYAPTSTSPCPPLELPR